jgi:hypothetical protein
MRWSDRWDQQHDGVVLMVENICGQGFTYTHDVEEDWTKYLVKLGLEKTTGETTDSAAAENYFSVPRPVRCWSFYSRSLVLADRSLGVKVKLAAVYRIDPI